MNNNHNMVPAPYKVSNPVGAEKVKAIDANILGKESWILGQCGNYYNTTQQRSFNNPKMDVQVMNNDRLAASVDVRSFGTDKRFWCVAVGVVVDTYRLRGRI